MKAVMFDRFGGPEVLELREQPVPEPRAGQVRVAVRAAALNPLDWKIRKGQMKIMSGSRFPMRMGADMAGVVEAVGPGVTRWRPGDEVFGTALGVKGGTFAELAVTGEGSLARKPARLSFEEAASVPVAAIAALAAVRKVAQVRQGTRVLINGCTGGVGLFALQIAKLLGAHVTGTCSAAGLAVARELGADEVLDYRQVDVVSRGGSYEALLELSGRLPFAQAQALLSPQGIYVDAAPTPAIILQSLVGNLFRSRKLKVLLSGATPELLEWLREHLESGKLRPRVDRTFALEEVSEATRYAERGGVLGKVVLRVGAG